MAEWDNTNAAGQHSVHVTLKGLDNDTYRGTLVLRNLSLIFGVHSGVQSDDSRNPVANMSNPLPGSPGHPEDPTGASYYVIAVVLVYGMSIVMLIASHIKRKHQKLMEDRQIDKYLREFQVVKEKSSRDSYKNLKRSIMAKLNMNNRNPTYKTLSHTILPMIAVGLPVALSEEGLQDIDVIATSGLRRGSLQASLFRHVQPSLNGNRPRRASDFDVHWRHLNGLHAHSLREGSVESCDSFRGRRSGSNSRSLPSTIEERESPSISNEMSTVVEMSEDDSPQSKVTSDVTPTETAPPRQTSERQQNDLHYYRPISISRACRVYEIPRNTPKELISPGGVHVALPGATTFNYRNTSPRSSHSPLQEGGEANNKSNLLSANSRSPRPSHRDVEEQHHREKMIGQATSESAMMNRSPDHNDNRLLVSDDDRKGETVRSPRSPLPSPRQRSPSPRLGGVYSLKDPHSFKSKLYERRMLKRMSDDEGSGAKAPEVQSHETKVTVPHQNVSPEPNIGLSPQLQTLSATKTPLHIDVPPGGGQRSGPRLSPQPLQMRRSSWTPSDHSGSRSSNDNLPKKSSYLAPPTESPVAKTTPDSSEFCSEASSECEEVWTASNRRETSPPEGTADAEASNRRPNYTDLEFRGLGSTPLLTPKESRKLDFSRDSRSTSPAYSQSSDSEKHVHHVTSV